MGEVLGCIERWEEKVGKLDEDNKLNNNMRCALLCTLCPKKLKDILELHSVGKKEYHIIKQEIIRLVESGVLGRVEPKPGGDKAMEIDSLPTFSPVDPAYTDYANAYMYDLAYMSKGGK